MSVTRTAGRPAARYRRPIFDPAIHHRPPTSHPIDMTTDELREAYLDFFASKGCVRRPSDVLVPNDPTVLFTPAGLNHLDHLVPALGVPIFSRHLTLHKCRRTHHLHKVSPRPALHPVLERRLTCSPRRC